MGIGHIDAGDIHAGLARAATGVAHTVETGKKCCGTGATLCSPMFDTQPGLWVMWISCIGSVGMCFLDARIVAHFPRVIFGVHSLGFGAKL